MRTKLEKELYEAGLCVACGGELDTPGKFVKCSACRERDRERAKAHYDECARELEDRERRIAEVRRKMAAEREAARAAEHARQRAEECRACEWVRLEADHIFCPLPICWKDQLREMAAEREAEKDAEAAG